MSVRIGVRGDIEGYVSDRALISGATGDEEQQRKREQSDTEMVKFSGVSTRTALVVIESANEELEVKEVERGSHYWRYLWKLKMKQLEKIQALMSHEHPKVQETAKDVYRAYKKMSPEKRRREYASRNPDVLHDSDVSAETTYETARVA